MARILRSNQEKLSFKIFFKKNLENCIRNILTDFPIKLKAFGLKNQTPPKTISTEFLEIFK